MNCKIELFDIRRIVDWISSHKIDTQPDFKRGNVWSKSEKQRLIDTILRGWIISPIQVVEDDLSGRWIVLDGQQRLQTIYSFLLNEFRINGYIEPLDSNIVNCDGAMFDDLDIQVKEEILHYKIGIVILSEYKPQEAAELFNRLNQPVKLTAAEMRNTYFGKTRDQIKELTDCLERMGLSKQTIGFSNSRMAYEEVLAKYCFYLEMNTIRYRITSSELTDRYRNDYPFNEETISIAKESIEMLSQVIYGNYDYRYKLALNKASLLSWLIFITQIILNHMGSLREISEVFYSFEMTRNSIKQFELGVKNHYKRDYSKIDRYPFVYDLINLYGQKSSIGSNDVKSIITRDACLYVFYCCNVMFDDYNSRQFDFFMTEYKKFNSFEIALNNMIDRFNWGGCIYEKNSYR